MSLTRPLTRPLTSPLTRALTGAGGGGSSPGPDPGTYILAESSDNLITEDSNQFVTE
jgi:hypothetical protein